MKVPWSSGEWRRVLVYGLGLSGRAALGLLRSKGVEVVGVDRRRREELDLAELEGPGIELLLGADPELLPAAVDGVVTSPGVPPDRPLLADARRRSIPVISEVELAFPFVEGTTVGITGSNGKSTTTALAGALLRAAGHAVEVCGNIGVPLSSCVEGPSGRVFVVELSSFQLEAVETFRPRAAALLNLSPDHLDRHPDSAAYLAIKAAIFARQEEGDLAVLNADDPLVAAVVCRARRRFFSRLRQVEDGCFLDGERILEARPGQPTVELFRRGDLGLPGPHNLENAMAAALLARAVGAEPRELRSGLAGFEGLPHRLQLVRERAGVSWYDDSKGTNVGATLRSLEGFPDRSVHLILGGRSKGADPRALLAVVERKARRLYLIGEAAAEFGRVLGPAAPCEQRGDLAAAVAAAARRAQPGEVVLLSPACASFDQYDNFAARGRHFQHLVRDLEGSADG